MKKTYPGHLTTGKLIFHTPYDFKQFALKHEGTDVKVTLSDGEKIRSIPQNNLYWKMLDIVSCETGNDKDTLHDFFRQKFLGDIIQVIGERFIRMRSTTTLTTAEFTRYLGNIRSYVYDETGIDLPIE